MSEGLDFSRHENRTIDIHREGNEGLSRRILVVDDDNLLLRRASLFLRDQGYEVVMAQSGEELLEILSGGEKFGVIISDNDMPGIKGIDALERIAQTAEYQGMHLVLQSAKIDTGLEERMEKIGGKTLNKPYDFGKFKDLLDGIYKKAN